jgi:hypothetical protein
MSHPMRSSLGTTSSYDRLRSCRWCVEPTLLGFWMAPRRNPEEFIVIEKPNTSQEKLSNSAYASSLTQDSQFLSYLNSTISKEVQVATLTTSEDVWKELHNMFVSQSRSRVMHLRSKLPSTSKGDMTTTTYFTKMKGYADEMAAAGKKLEDDDIVSCILTILDADYKPQEKDYNLYAQLLSAEACLENQNGIRCLPTLHTMEAMQMVVDVVVIEAEETVVAEALDVAVEVEAAALERCVSFVRRLGTRL